MATKRKKSKKAEKPAFARVVARPRRREAGRTAIASTPVAIRGLVPRDVAFEREMRETLARALGRFATFMERGTVRFEDVNGPRGGIDTECRVKIVMSGLPSVIATARARTPERAFTAVVPKLKAATAGLVGKKGLAAPAPTHPARAPARRAKRSGSAPDAGSLIGRRVGRSAANVEAVLARPEKVRRDVYVDTAEPGVSASDRRVGAGSTARRNAKRRTSRMTVTLEDSRTGRPSRKSTRKSKNRAKSGSKQARRARAETASPSSRARRASAARS